MLSGGGSGWVYILLYGGYGGPVGRALRQLHRALVEIALHTDYGVANCLVTSLH